MKIDALKTLLSGLVMGALLVGCQQEGDSDNDASSNETTESVIENVSQDTQGAMDTLKKQAKDMANTVEETAKKVEESLSEDTP